jgi:hypothetical protein
LTRYFMGHETFFEVFPAGKLRVKSGKTMVA